MGAQGGAGGADTAGPNMPAATRGKSAPWLTCSRKSSFIEESLLFKSHNLEPIQFLSVNVYLQARKNDTHMHSSQGCCALSSWREHSRCSQLAVLLCGAEAFKVAVLITVQRLCVAPDDDGDFYGSSSRSVPVELHRVRLPQPACTLHTYAVPGLISHN